jgi:HK97 family phage major capsid protein
MSKLDNTPKQKTLSIGNGHLVAERVATKIVEQATPTHLLLNEIDLIDVETIEYKELVVTSRPQIRHTGEQNGVTLQVSNGESQHYTSVGSLFGKVYVQTLMTDEIVTDAKLTIEDEFVRLASNDFLDALINEILLGDETKTDGVQKLRGLLNTRIDKANSFVEALKDDSSRDTEFYQVTKTGSPNSFGGTPADIKAHFAALKKSLPSKYKRNAKWYMNADTFEALEAVTDTVGQPLLISWGRSVYSGNEAFIMLGHPIVIIDQMPDIGANETPLIFGDMRAAIKALSLTGEGSHLVVDKLTVKGAFIIYIDTRYGEIMQANDSIRVSLQAA